MQKMLKVLSKEQFQDTTLLQKLRDEHSPDNSDETLAEFEAACENFRSVCREIGSLLGVDDFKGGFDEMLVFQQSEAALTQEGLMLAMKWSAADKLCTYIADRKLKIGQPAWWKQCWGMTD